MSASTESSDVDFYQLLNVAVTSTVQEIKIAYRKTALKYHPDKVGNNPEAVEKFITLTRAVEILSDPQKRTAYDNEHKARLAKKEKFEKLDKKRRLDREDLERRENEYAKRQRNEPTDESLRKAEIERLRAEGLRWLAEMEKEREAASVASSIDRGTYSFGPTSSETKAQDTKTESTSQYAMEDTALDVKWKSKKRVVDKAMLEVLFRQYGEVEAVAMRKEGRAMVVFASPLSADQVIKEFETGSVLFDGLTIGRIGAKSKSGKGKEREQPADLIDSNSNDVPKPSASVNNDRYSGIEPRPSTTTASTAGAGGITSGYSFNFVDEDAARRVLSDDELRFLARMKAAD
ncbi:hypothetical protein HDU76_008580 [Blyttiomyces sp. JEL0837]|nr:hypothetical protein HDU76_008580 [Blyttiomyces sp. JEL0837]